MKYITLVCAAGMSTSLLMSKMIESAKNKNIEVTIKAMPESKFAAYEGETDILLLGPQISYLYENIKKEYEPKGIKVCLVNIKDYGRMNGEKVLMDSLALIEN
ncbi:MAG: PTS sugar transporter subunit IIB [Eubacteriales bacterium]